MSMFPGPPAMTAPTSQMEEIGANNDDIRRMSETKEHAGVRQRLWGVEARLDPTVTFEEFTFWAKVEREMEMADKHREIKSGSGGMFSFLQGKKSRGHANNIPNIPYAAVNEENTSKEKSTGMAGQNGGDGSSPIGPSSTHDVDAEWRTAARALRTASWSGVFYLITTDILGWGQTPYVFSNLGYGLGVGMFVLMGLMAALSGFFIWKIFLALDSSRYPMITFGDSFFRLYGPVVRHIINVAQALQMFLTVAVILLGQTFIIVQLSESVSLCFIACAVINLAVSMAGGFMRTLKHVGWFANAAVWLNVISFIIICVAAAKYGPDPTYASLLGILPHEWAKHPVPVVTFVGAVPVEYQPTNSDPFAAKFSGINSIVYAYSGAVLFMAFLSEMRHPLDFWKAVFLAQGFICVVYVFFGCFAYTYYGQYSYSTINNVVRPFSLQVVSNVLGLITGWIATYLYFNVGLKTVYVEVGMEIFHLPSITTSRGKFLWKLLGPVYWILGFVVSMSIPQFNAFTSFVGALFSLNFTYSFAGIMYLGYQTQEGARLPGEGFDASTGVTARHDGGMKRWARGFLKNWYITIPTLIFTCAGLAASGMGTWSAILALEEAFAQSVTTSWSCAGPS